MSAAFPTAQTGTYKRPVPGREQCPNVAPERRAGGNLIVRWSEREPLQGIANGCHAVGFRGMADTDEVPSAFPFESNS